MFEIWRLPLSNNSTISTLRRNHAHVGTRVAVREPTALKTLVPITPIVAWCLCVGSWFGGTLSTRAFQRIKTLLMRTAPRQDGHDSNQVLELWSQESAPGRGRESHMVFDCFPFRFKSIPVSCGNVLLVGESILASCAKICTDQEGSIGASISTLGHLHTYYAWFQMANRLGPRTPRGLKTSRGN